MQRNYKLIIASIALTVSSLCAFAQDTVEYKDVFLDGKPAKLNVATGEVKLVNLEVKEVKTPSVSSNTEETTGKHNYVHSAHSNDDAESDFYEVKEGETLFDVSKKYNVSLTELKRENNLETTLINKGQKLRVKNFDSVIESTSSSNTYSETNNLNFYIVERGNTLFSLAHQFNLSVNQLKRMNNLNSNVIKVGQKLRVNNVETSNETNNLSIYVVKRGDNLYRIALNNGTTVNSIKHLNGLTSNVIQIGQRLQLK